MNVGKRYVLGLFVVLACICMLNVSVISASSTDADYYAKVLKNQQFIADADGNMEQGIDFILYDINNACSATHQFRFVSILYKYQLQIIQFKP